MRLGARVGKTLPLTVALLLLFGAYKLLQIAKKYEPGVQLPPGYNQAGLGDLSVQFGQSTVISRESGVTVWELKADRIDLHRDPSTSLEQFRQADVVGIHGGVLYQKGKPSVRFSASTAQYNPSLQRLDVRGRVAARTLHNDQLTTDDLVWSAGDAYIRFPAGATALVQGNTLTAPSALFAPSTEVLECPMGANAVFKGNPVHASVLTWNIPARLVELPGPIDGSYHGITYRAQNATLNLNPWSLSANMGELNFRTEDVNTLQKGLR